MTRYATIGDFFGDGLIIRALFTRSKRDILYNIIHILNHKAENVPLSTFGRGAM
jgi:hypothetical protein